MSSITKRTKAGKNARRVRIITGLLTAVQVLFAAALYALHYLSHKKAGVNHYVVFKKFFYFKTLLTPAHVTVYGILTAIILAGLLVLCIKTIRTRQSLTRRISLGLLIILAFCIELELFIPQIRELAIYVYLLSGTVLLWGIELIKSLIMLPKLYLP